MNITIKINTDNDVFQDGGQRIQLNQILDDCKNHLSFFEIERGKFKLHDSNGNTCGYIEVSESD